MRKFLVAVMFGLMAIATQAEATFEQIEGLIQQKNYAAAASGLETVIQNHPKSAKAFYAMAQAQAGLGNLEKAQKALNIATGLNPTLDFAPSSSVQSLKDAITPQTSKIVVIEESHFWRNFWMGFIVFAGGGLIIALIMQKQRKEEEAELSEKLAAQAAQAERDAKRKQEHMEMLAKQDAERKAELKAEEELKAHKNYNHERFDPANPDKLKSVAQFKKEQQEAARVLAEAEAERTARIERYRQQDANSRMNAYSTPAPTVTHVHHNNSGNDMLTGVLIGNMLSGSHHDTTKVVEREVVREVPATSRSSSWDDTPSTSSRSSSWDDTPSRSSSSSSSWDSGSSSSSSSSSWDSGSSSSDSSSSSSWD